MSHHIMILLWAGLSVGCVDNWNTRHPAGLDASSQLDAPTVGEVAAEDSPAMDLAPTDTPSTCATGTICSGRCADLMTDLSNCGACGVRCVGTCEGGQCACQRCSISPDDCPGTAHCALIASCRAHGCVPPDGTPSRCDFAEGFRCQR